MPYGITQCYLPPSRGDIPVLQRDRTQVQISPWTVIAMATAIYSLGHRLCLTAVLRSTQPCIPLGSLNRVPVSAVVRDGMSYFPHSR